MEEKNDQPDPSKEHPADAGSPQPPVPESDPIRNAVPHKILESLEKEANLVTPQPPPPAPAEKVVAPASAEPESVDPGEEMLIPKSMQVLEQVLKSIKEKAKAS